MIYRNGKLITLVQNNLTEIIDLIELKVLKKIGAIHKGSLLVWLTVYNAIRSCFGSGTWIQDRPWLGDDTWKNN